MYNFYSCCWLASVCDNAIDDVSSLLSLSVQEISGKEAILEVAIASSI